MGRCLTVVGLALCWLGTAVLSVSCYAQEQAVKVAVEKSADASESSSRDRVKSSVIVQPAGESLERDNRVGLPLLKNIAQDQKAIWIGPKHLRFSDADWLVPLGGATAAMFATDTEFSKHLSNSPSRIKYSKDLSNYGLGAMSGVTGGLWLWGHMTHDDHKIETGVLAGEAAVDSVAMFYPLKYAFGRERPLYDAYRGRFGVGGDSFPSGHAALAWSMASVIAHEYPGPLTSLFAYGLASAVSTSRITGKQHFPSDVLIGSAIGWLEGMYVYRKHHDPRIGGGEWETYAEAHESPERNSGNLGSPYVPLDSWIYPAMERLAGLGLMKDEYMGMRPWTRGECARLVGSAMDQVESRVDTTAEASKLIADLQNEFRSEIEGVSNGGAGAFRLESAYSRTQHISGMPLTDGFHFGQTQFNDFGRPYGEGWNTVNGVSAYAAKGRWITYVRAEIQTAPVIAALPLSAREAIQAEDHNGVPPGIDEPPVLRTRLLDSYVGVVLSNWQVSFGKQSLWWGPGDGGPLDLSNNAEPINMFRVNRTVPLKLPSILGWLGPIRTEFFLGQLSGHQFLLSPLGQLGQFGQTLSPQPLMHGQKLSFRPTPNFEFGFFRTTIYGGPGYPFTSHTFLRSLLSTGNTLAGQPGKPGKRTSGLDFSYRLPGLRNFLTFYGDGVVWDQFSPIAYADRSAWHAGLYLSHFPVVNNLDLRVEGVFTDLPIGGNVGHGFFYFDGTWQSGYTNNGNIMGSWIGKDGQGAQAWMNYWYSPKNRIQVSYRHQKVSQQFVDGGTVTDVGLRTDYWVRPSLSVSASMQWEKWLFPVIQPTGSRNISATLQISFQPEKLLRASQVNTRPEVGELP